MPSLVDELNINIKPFCEAVKNGDFIPTEFKYLDGGFTTFSSQGDDAIALNPPIAGQHVSLINEPGIDVQPDGDRFILRSVIGYAMAARYLSNPAVFSLNMINLINHMTSAAYKFYGPRIIKLKFDRPGQDNFDYLRELQNSAGYEIRLYGELHPPLSFEMEIV
jgi:hypothetical protein